MKIADEIPEPDKALLMRAAYIVLRAIEEMALDDEQAAELVAGSMRGAWRDGWGAHRDTAALRRAPIQPGPTAPADTRLLWPPPQPS